jgi:hypothetical protein
MGYEGLLWDIATKIGCHRDGLIPIREYLNSMISLSILYEMESISHSQ